MEQIDYDVDEFIDYCTSKNLSTKTIGSYEQTLRLLAQYLKDNYKVKSAGDTKELHIREYIKYLQEKVSSSKNTNNYSYTGRNNLKSQSVSPEINLLGLTVDEAIPLVDKYLDDCFMAKLSPVRIVHGKGTGALRNGIHKYLKTNKYVDSYRMGTFGEGEMGVTIVTLKIK